MRLRTRPPLLTYLLTCPSLTRDSSNTLTWMGSAFFAVLLVAPKASSGLNRVSMALIPYMCSWSCSACATTFAAVGSIRLLITFS